MDDDDALVEPLQQGVLGELDDNGEEHANDDDHADDDDDQDDPDEEAPVMTEGQQAAGRLDTVPIKLRYKSGPHGQPREKLIGLQSLFSGTPGYIGCAKQGTRDLPEFRVVFTNRATAEPAFDRLCTEGLLVCGKSKYTVLFGAKHCCLISYDARDAPFDAAGNPTRVGFPATDYDPLALFRDYSRTDRQWTRNFEIKFTTFGKAQFDGTSNVSMCAMVSCYPSRLGVETDAATRELDTFIRIEDSKRMIRGVESQTYLMAKFHNVECVLCGKVGHHEGSVICYLNPNGISYHPPVIDGPGGGRGGGGRGGGGRGGPGGGRFGGPPPYDGDPPGGGPGQGRNVGPRR